MSSSTPPETRRQSEAPAASNAQEDKKVAEPKKSTDEQSADKLEQPWKRFLAEETAARQVAGANDKQAPHNWRPDSKESVQKPWLEWIQKNYDPKELEKEKDCEEYFSGTTAAEGG